MPCLHYPFINLLLLISSKAPLSHPFILCYHCPLFLTPSSPFSPTSSCWPPLPSFENKDTCQHIALLLTNKTGHTGLAKPRGCYPAALTLIDTTHTAIISQYQIAFFDSEKEAKIAPFDSEKEEKQKTSYCNSEKQNMFFLFFFDTMLTLHRLKLPQQDRIASSAAAAANKGRKKIMVPII